MKKSAFQPVQKENLSEDIAAQVRKEILQGAYKPGERFPSERELALAFGVTRTTVREALIKLQAMGLIKIRQGAGIEVQDWRRTGNVELLIHLLTTPDKDGRFDGRALASILEAAKALYLETVGLAFGRMEPAEWKRIEALLRRQLELFGDIDAFIAGDTEIHQAVFEGAHSVALQLLHNTFLEIYQTYSSPFRLFFEAELKRGDKSRVLRFYRDALDALLRRDLAAMKKLVSVMFEPGNPNLFAELVRKYTF